MSEDILRLTIDLYAFVKDSEELTTTQKTELNPQRFREWAEQLRLRFDSAKTKASRQLQAPMISIRDNLRGMLDELRKQHPSRGKLRALWLSLGKSYEALALRLEKASEKLPKKVKLDHLKTNNYVRNLFHFGNSLWAILLYELVFDKTGITIVAGGFLALAIWMEVIRRLSPEWNRRFCDKIFGAVSRPHEEYSITAATWYSLALFIGVILMPQHAIEAGALMLGVGDPIAAVVGMKFGKHTLVGKKTLEGSLGFFLSSTLALCIFFALVTPLSWGSILLLSSGVALGGTLAELFTGKIEDNFSIPLVGGFLAMALLFML